MGKIVANGSTATSSPIATTGEVWDGRKIHSRYVAGIDELVRDAIDNQATQVLADALTLTLARMVVVYNKPFVPGDILRRFGDHICTLVEHDRAQAQAAKAKEEGRVPN